MATDSEIVGQMDGWLRAHGYICGRNYADLGDVARGIVAVLPGETEQTLEPKIRRLASTPGYGFKSAGVDNVSASDPRCGS